jgi:hypothetical protein
LDDPAAVQGNPKQIALDFSPEETALRYEQLFTELLALRGRELREA